MKLKLKGRWLWIVISANLLVLVGLAFAYPHLMVGPGPLMPEHAALATDCFSCHAPLRGASSERCIACHALPDIGRRTTKGLAIKTVSAAGASGLKASFHQDLTEQVCTACHSDHAGPKLTQHSRKPFSHALLRTATRNSCESCHQAPTGTLHKQLTGNCAQCHQFEAWKPATFDHAKLFVLDGDHNATCVTCHTDNNYQQYTCYGCHEHSRANVLAKHREEGITESLQNCVSCHRSASGEPEGKGNAERGKGQRERD